MITVKKLLLSFLTAIVLSSFFTATVFASETAPVDAQTVQDTTEDIDNVTQNLDSEEAASGDITDTDANDAADPSVEDEDALIEEDLADNGSSEDGTYVEEDTEEVEEDLEEVEETDTADMKEKKPSYSEEDLRLLACLVYSEAGNQSYNGMLGVANVVLNRVKSDVYWHVDTIKEVIYDHKWSVQFAVTVKNSKTGISMMDKALKSYDTGKFTGSNPESQKNSMARAIKAAKAALNGKNNIGDYLCFQNKRILSSIKKKYSSYKIIGDHIFYRTK